VRSVWTPLNTIDSRLWSLGAGGLSLFFEHVTHMPAVLAVYVLPPLAVVTWLKFRYHILDVPRENRSDDPEEPQ
jgi:hypothetical protein